MFLENKIYLETQLLVDDRISRAIDNDHTAAMKAPNIGKKHLKKNGHYSNANEMIAVCMLCKKAFKNHLMYRKHMRLHGDKSHQCQLCGKVFNKKHYLQIHMQTHAKHQYQCHLCPKRFSLKANFNQHLKFHTAKKTHSCSICGKDFYQQEHLKAHLRHHTNERPYECELCHKSFNIKSSLQRHMNCHTGEKPFICDICNRGYTRRSVLMLHIQQVHENKKPFQCDECNLCFSQKGNLQAHFKRKHLQPKSDGKRGKDKGSGKKALKRRHTAFSEDPPLKTKPQMDNTSLHSYASKVKAIVSRGARAQVTQLGLTEKRVNLVFKNGIKGHLPHKLNASKTQDVPVNVTSIKHDATPVSPRKPNMSPSDSASTSSLSDESPDTGCGSSSGDDMPAELNFPSILEHSSLTPYDVKPLHDYETLFENDQEWGDYLVSDQILNASLTNYGLGEDFSKIGAPPRCEGGDELFNWNDTDCGTNPLFTADDLDDIKDISSMCGLSIESIKMEPPDLDKRSRCTLNSKTVNSNSLHKINSAGPSLLA